MPTTRPAPPPPLTSAKTHRRLKQRVAWLCAAIVATTWGAILLDGMLRMASAVLLAGCLFAAYRIYKSFAEYWEAMPAAMQRRFLDSRGDD